MNPIKCICGGEYEFKELVQDGEFAILECNQCGNKKTIVQK